MFDYAHVIPQVVAEMKPSGIRKYFGILETMPDAISLGVGEPDFITPQHIMQAGIDSLYAGKTQYTANAGLTLLRKEIGKYMKDFSFSKLGKELNFSVFKISLTFSFCEICVGTIRSP